MTEENMTNPANNQTWFKDLKFTPQEMEETTRIFLSVDYDGTFNMSFTKNSEREEVKKAYFNELNGKLDLSVFPNLIEVFFTLDYNVHCEDFCIDISKN